MSEGVVFVVDDDAAICRALELSPAHFDRVLYRAKQRMRVLPILIHGAH